LFRKFPFWSSHQDMQCIDSRGDCLDCLEIFFLSGENPVGDSLDSGK
jgi:hypothetical protein